MNTIILRKHYRFHSSSPFKLNRIFFVFPHYYYLTLLWIAMPTIVHRKTTTPSSSVEAFQLPSVIQRQQQTSPSFVRPSTLLKGNSAIANAGEDNFKENGSSSSSAEQQQRLILVGGGHAHVQVIKALNKQSRPKNLQVTLIDMQKAASYSGMVPGCIAGMYDSDETLLHLQPLADWANIEFINDQVVDLDLERNLVYCRNNQDTPYHFDVLSLDIGSGSRGLGDTLGTREYTIPTRPIHDLITRIDAKEQELLQKQEDDVHVVIIGGGAAGVELSLSIHGRWSNTFRNLQVTILDVGTALLPNESPACRTVLLEILKEKNIHVKYQSGVAQVQKDAICLRNGQCVPYDVSIWATGAAPHPLALKLQQEGLAGTPQGWIRVNKYLQSLSHPNVFAAGDCANVELDKDQSSLSPVNNDGPSSPSLVPKAGVYAVRSGPVLIDNLTKMLQLQRQQSLLDHDRNDAGAKSPLTVYTPQEDFLKLIVCGDGKALGFRFGISIHGKWVMKLKDTIDQKFMDLFRAEHLPVLKEGAPYDTSQYDANFLQSEQPEPIEPIEAAKMLQRTDDGVDFEVAWKVLRDMAGDKLYREEVLFHYPRVLKGEVPAQC